MFLYLLLKTNHHRSESDPPAPAKTALMAFDLATITSFSSVVSLKPFLLALTELPLRFSVH